MICGVVEIEQLLVEPNCLVSSSQQIEQMTSPHQRFGHAHEFEWTVVGECGRALLHSLEEPEGLFVAIQVVEIKGDCLCELYVVVIKRVKPFRGIDFRDQLDSLFAISNGSEFG